MPHVDLFHLCLRLADLQIADSVSTSPAAAVNLPQKEGLKNINWKDGKLNAEMMKAADYVGVFRSAWGQRRKEWEKVTELLVKAKLAPPDKTWRVFQEHATENIKQFIKAQIEIQRHTGGGTVQKQQEWWKDCRQELVNIAAVRSILLLYLISAQDYSKHLRQTEEKRLKELETEALRSDDATLARLSSEGPKVRKATTDFDISGVEEDSADGDSSASGTKSNWYFSLCVRLVLSDNIFILTLIDKSQEKGAKEEKKKAKKKPQGRSRQRVRDTLATAISSALQHDPAEIAVKREKIVVQKELADLSKAEFELKKKNAKMDYLIRMTNECNDPELKNTAKEELMKMIRN